MKKILVSMFLLVFCLCLAGCETLVKNPTLASIVKDEEFTSAYVSSVFGDAQVIPVDYNDLKEKEFYKNIMNSNAKITDVLPEAIPSYSLIISSAENSLQIDDLGDLYAKYNDEWYCIECETEDRLSLHKYLLDKEEQSYKLTIQNETEYDLIGIKDEYKAGEEVEVKMIYEDDVVTFVYLNGKNIGWLNGGGSVKFNMPNEDSVLVITYSDEETYKLTVIDDFGYLVKPLDNYYKAGEEVEVQLVFTSGPSVGININGEYIGEESANKYVGANPVISFIMPNKDSTLYTTMNGNILRDCGDGNHKWDEGREIDGGNGAYVMKYFCELCCQSKEEIITIIPSENKILSDCLTKVNPNCIYLNSDTNSIGRMSSYKDFKEQLFFNNLSQIELIAIDDNVDYEVAQVDYYIKFFNTLTDSFVILELFDVIGNNNSCFYGWLKTSYLNDIFEFQMGANLFQEIYNYFVNDIETVNYYAFENGDYIETSNYSCQKITNIILESEEITYEQSEIENLVLDLSITTYEPTSGVYPMEMSKYNYVWRLDYETGIAEFCTIAPVISSQIWPNRYFKLSQEEVVEIKDNLTKQPYELINDFELLSFYHNTMLISDVEGFPFIVITEDVGTTSRLARVHERYNEEFFNEYALMIIEFETNSTEKIIGIDDIKFDGNKFTTVFDIKPGFTDDYIIKYFVLKIKKSTLPILEKASYDVEIKVNNLSDPNGDS